MNIFKNSRFLFLLSFSIAGLLLITEMKRQTEEVNAVTDRYLSILTKSAWMIGCVQGTNGSFAFCHVTADSTNFDKLRIDLQKVADESDSKE